MYLKEVLYLKSLKNITIENTDGAKSTEMFLRQWGLTNDVNLIYPDGTKNYWKSKE